MAGGHRKLKGSFMNATKRTLFIVLTLIFLISACSAQTTQVQPASPQTQIIEPVFTPSGDLPLTERDVPRVSIEEAKAASDSGTATLVDVRNPPAFESRHIAGAINIPLGEIERDPTDLPLNADQWIITYCT